MPAFRNINGNVIRNIDEYTHNKSTIKLLKITWRI